MSVKWWYIGILVILISPALKAESWHSRSERAEHFFKNKNYDQAEKEYKALISEYPGSWEFQFNLANTYYKNNKIGQAIVAYKRALKLNPRNKTILKNQSIVLSKIGDMPQQEVPLKISLKSGLDYISIYEILALFLAIWTLTLGLTALYQNKPSEGLKNTIILGGGILIIISIPLFLKIVIDSGIIEAIAIEKKVAVKSGPSQTFPTVGLLQEGRTVWIEDDRSGWKKITTRTGITGWIEAKKIEYISP